jgi:hypothetical protein
VLFPIRKFAWLPRNFLIISATITLSRRIVAEQFIVIQMVKKFHIFMEPGGPSTCSEKHVNATINQANQLHIRTTIFLKATLILFSSQRPDVSTDLFQLRLPANIFINVLLVQLVLHTLQS